MEMVVAAAVFASACLAIVVVKFGFEAILDRADGGFHRPARGGTRPVVVLVVVLAVVAAVLWAIAGILAVVG